jgi:capsular exopolysaccharide synthesis family protein
VILALALAGTGLAWGYWATQPTLYKSMSSVFVSSQRGETTTELVQGSTFTQNLVQSYAQLATTPAVLDPVIEKLGLTTSAQELAKTLTVNTPLNTVIIEISAVDQSSTRAATIADAVTASLSSVVQSLAPKGPNNAPSITMAPISSAQVATEPSSPNTALILVTGLLAGLVVGVLYALARELFDTKVRGEKDLSRVSDAPLLGKVGHKRRQEPTGLIMRVMPQSALGEAYRRICANLEFIDVDRRPRSMVITSPLSHDGKSTTAINLALALAERSPRVLLIDADLRRPTIAEMCGVEGGVGLTTVLVGAVTAEEAITVWGGVLHVLPSGAVPPNPSQLLGSIAMKDLLTRLSAQYDFIVIDSPPLLSATDALGLAHIADGAIVVARYKSTRRAQLASTLDALEDVHARVLGIVLNQVRERRPEAYYGTVEARPRASRLRSGPPKGVSAPQPASAAVPFGSTATTTEANAPEPTRAV